MLFLLTVASFLFLDKLNSATSTNSVSYQNEYQRVTARALAEAKAALIGYALTYAETHPGQPLGFLPCPNKIGDGDAFSGACGAAGQSVIGWLPWRTLRISPLRDGAGECLWYAVSGNYKHNPKVSLTSDTDGQFVIKEPGGNTLAGVDPSGSDRAIAIIFAPGAPINTQSRTPGGAITECASTIRTAAINQTANYLETLSNGVVSINNSNGTEPPGGYGLAAGGTLPALPFDPSTFVSAPKVVDVRGNLLINDTLVAITPQDFATVYERMDHWVANRVRQCLSSPYPWAAALNATLDFDDDLDRRFGRIPDVRDNSGGSWGADPNDTTRTCFQDSWNTSPPGPKWSWWWWDTWKERVFYVVAANFAPGGGSVSSVALQLSDPELSAPAESQFVVAVAGRRLSGQQRTPADKANIANYLEGQNNPLFPSPPSPSLNGPGHIPDGDEQFVKAATSTTFNDTVCSDSVPCAP